MAEERRGSGERRGMVVVYFQMEWSDTMGGVLGYLTMVVSG
jgi:hypothetical protein